MQSHESSVASNVTATRCGLHGGSSHPHRRLLGMDERIIEKGEKVCSLWALCVCWCHPPRRSAQTKEAQRIARPSRSANVGLFVGLVSLTRD